ncbi:MAG: MscL family protein [Candidatus Thorarchaeota archaeon]
MSNEEQVLEELREIRKLLTPPKPPEPPKGFVDEFVVFLKKSKVMGLAVAFILALYIGALIQSFVFHIIMPIIGVFIPSTESWDSFYIQLTDSQLSRVMIGTFTGNLITFIVIAFIVFLLVKLTSRLGLE